MPTLPIIDNVFRCTLNITSATKPSVHNTFHVRTTAPAAGPDVASALLDVLALANVDNIIQCLPTDYSVTSLSVLPLNGITAATNVAVVTSPPSGLQTGEIVPEACVIITGYSLLRGPAGRSRVFIGPVCESVIANGVPLSTMVTTMTTAWNNMRTNIAAETPDMEMVVASYTNAIANTLENYVGKPYAGTQRRRLVRLRWPEDSASSWLPGAIMPRSVGLLTGMI